jgi:hypothetical protein
MIKLFVSNGVAPCFDSGYDEAFLSFETFTDEIGEAKAADAFDLRADYLLIVEVWVA